jgi:hypothetical protein
MTTKKNKKQVDKNGEDIAYTFLGIILMAFLLLFPMHVFALILFSIFGATSARWEYWAALGRTARERTDPDNYR